VAVRGKNRQFPTAYKLKAIKRVERGEGVLPVARDLGIARKLLHDWIKAWKAHGPEGLNRKRGPKPGPRKLKPLPTYEDKRSALAQAKTRIAELERLVGRRQWTSIFFGKPCAHWGDRQRKANPYPHHRSHRNHDIGGSRFPCRRTAPVPLAGLPRATYYQRLARHDGKAAIMAS
jgi:transposase